MSAQMQPTTTREWRVPDPPTGFDALRLQEASIGPLGATDVLINVHAVSLQYRDMLVANGKAVLGEKKSLVPGSDAAGEIVSVGSEVKKWKAGDRVSANFNTTHIRSDLTHATTGGALGAEIDGVLSTYKTSRRSASPSYGPVQAQQYSCRCVCVQSLVAIPPHLSYEEASTLPCAAVTAYNALRGGLHPLKGGDTVRIEGTGGVSIFALQFAVASGAVPIVLTSSAEKMAAVMKLGAAHVINYKEVPDWQDEVLKLTDGEGVHHVIDVAGGKTLDKALRCTRHGGTVSVIGIVDGASSSPDVGVQCIIRGISIRGIQIGSRTQFEDMNRLLAARQIRPVVDRTISFEKLVDALNYLESQKHVGKVVINVS